MQARTRLRSMLAYRQPVRSIVHAALVPEVQHALNNWPLTEAQQDSLADILAHP